MKLEDYVGQTVLLKVAHNFGAADPEAHFFAVLEGVDTGGIWIKSDEILDLIGQQGRIPVEQFKRSPIFVPYSAIQYIEPGPLRQKNLPAPEF